MRYRRNQSNQVDGGGGEVDIGCPRNGGDGQWHLTVSAMDEDETAGDGHSMDAAMDFSMEVARQWRRIMQLTVAAGGD